MASLEITRANPGRDGTIAASSIRPRASGAPSASGRSSRAMASNSSTPLGGLAPDIPSDSVEDAVGDAGLGAFEERLGDLDVFVDGHLGGHIGSRCQLHGPGTQDGAQGG